MKIATTLHLENISTRLSVKRKTNKTTTTHRKTGTHTQHSPTFFQERGGRNSYSTSSSISSLLSFFCCFSWTSGPTASSAHLPDFSFFSSDKTCKELNQTTLIHIDWNILRRHHVPTYHPPHPAHTTHSS